MVHRLGPGRSSPGCWGARSAISWCTPPWTGLQAATETAVEGTLAKAGTRNQVDEAAVVVLDTSGAVRAMVGGRDHRDGPFNRAVGAKRQPGSAFKPFVYLAAVEAGWQPGNLIDDRPLNIKGWEPANFDGKFRGQITLADAFAHSINTSAVRLAQTVGPERVAEKARELGVVSPVQAVPSIALGTSEVSLLELTGAYLPFATGGTAARCIGVTLVEDDAGKVYYRHVATEVRVIRRELQPPCGSCWPAWSARALARPPSFPIREAAGKTGTTQNGRDAWFVGYAGAYVAGVWLGNDDNRPMKGVLGSNLPARIWRSAMLATPPPERAIAAAVPAAKPSQASGLEWFLDLITGRGSAVIN